MSLPAPAANFMNTLNSTINSLFNQPPTLLFHYEGEQTATFESDITDHFIETNDFINDHIALKPGVITTQGFIGELNDIPPNTALQLLQITANSLVSIASYAPGLSVTALEAYNEAFSAYQAASNAVVQAQSAYNSISGGSTGETVITAGQITSRVSAQNKQQTMFQQLFAYQQARILFTIQTPWAVFTNCAIQSLKAVQDPDTQVITDFNVTFKQMRFVSDLLPVNTSNIATGRLSGQSQVPVNNGTSSPGTASVSLSQLTTNLAD